MKQHRLKTHPQYFERILSGDKTFEVRKNDRDFQVGDEIILEEWYPESESYSGDWALVRVTYLLQGGQFGIEDDYIVMSIRILSTGADPF